MIKNPQLIYNKLNHIKDPKEALLLASKEMSMMSSVSGPVMSPKHLTGMNDRKLKRILLSNPSKVATSLQLNQNN